MSDTGPNSSPPDIDLPGGLDIRRAFDAYVFGRNRNIEPAEKQSAVAGDSSTGPAGATEPVIQAEEGTVSVPLRSQLRYDRNAGTWRVLTEADRGG